MSALTVVIIGVLTFAIRGAFILRRGRVPNARPTPWLARVPAAILPLLAASALYSAVASPADAPKIIAAAAAALIAWRRRNLLLSLGVGMGTLWLLDAVV